MKPQTEQEALRDAGFTEEQLTRLEDAGVIKPENGES
jgi:hypothetical protein